MKESISYTYLLNMMLVFIFVSFAVILVTMSYSKAYRINSKIAGAIETSEGFNDLAKSEINRLIRSFGYQQPNVNCKKHGDAENISDIPGLCVYEFKSDQSDNPDYYYYGITTYMLFDIPLVNLLKLPVYNTTEKIYNFDNLTVGSDVE